MVKILLIEDNAITAAAMMDLLNQQQYIVESVQDFNWAWHLLKQSKYDLIAIDATLPQLDGISLCRRIRSHSIQTPIVIIADQGPMSEKTIGLDAGANDYLVKPFDPDELCARIRALLRRSMSVNMFCFDWGSLYLNPVSAEVTALETTDIPAHASSSENTNTMAIRKTDPESTQALIRQVWMQSYDRIQSHIETVQVGITSLLTPDFQPTAESHCLVAARQEAHTLSGSLEIFGFMRASKIAKHIELGFLNPAVLNADDGEQFHALLIDLRKEISPSEFLFEEDRR